jgi:hypothetical protein
MNKDVIYIDIEDDITGIIGKVKAAGSKIVALVPPKRAGVLQSAVNLKLLQRAADATDKRVVLITSDHSLTALAAGVRMPVAKNLQSRPEVPELEAPTSDDEEIINGAELPVGEMAAAMGSGVAAASPKTLADKVGEDVDLRDAPKAKDLAAAGSGATAAKKAATPLGKKVSSKLNIPDFATFRNKFFLFGGIGAFLVIFLIWALVFAPHAKITISAQTIAVNIDRTLSLDPKAAASDTGKLALKPAVQTLKKSVATTFAATGQKDIGNKASGTITVYNCDSGSSFMIEAGTTFVASGGKQFKSNAATNVGGLSGSASSCRNSASHSGAGTGSVAVTAVDLGDEYNVPAGDFSITGIGGDIYASSSSAMAGGSHQMATVVSQEDVDKAKGQLAQPDTSGAKNELKKQFQGDYIVIEESFTSDQGQPSVEPAVGQQAQQAKVTVETTYTYVAVTRDDIKKVAGDVVNEALQGKENQQMYSLGDTSVAFQVFQKNDSGIYTARLIATGFIGPKIDTDALAEQITGKRFGEIQTLVNQIPGVQKVDIQLSPFWVNTAPSPDKIDVSFSVANGK